MVTKETFQGILLGKNLKGKPRKKKYNVDTNKSHVKKTPNFYDKTDNYTFFLTPLMIYIQVLKFSNYIEE